MTHYTLFTTALGTCGIAWSTAGISAVQLPEESAEATRRRLLHKAPHAVEEEPTDAVRSIIERIRTLLTGQRTDLADIQLDDSDVPEFNRRVYALARQIPPGATRTYGSIAKELGDPLLAQQVGVALGRNPFPIIIPCHRVLAANGKLGGFSAPGGVDTKKRMLLIEGALPDEPLSLFGT